MHSENSDAEKRPKASELLQHAFVDLDPFDIDFEELYREAKVRRLEEGSASELASLASLESVTTEEQHKETSRNSTVSLNCQKAPYNTTTTTSTNYIGGTDAVGSEIEQLVLSRSTSSNVGQRKSFLDLSGVGDCINASADDTSTMNSLSGNNSTAGYRTPVAGL